MLAMPGSLRLFAALYHGFLSPRLSAAPARPALGQEGTGSPKILPCSGTSFHASGTRQVYQPAHRSYSRFSRCEEAPPAQLSRAGAPGRTEGQRGLFARERHEARHIENRIDIAFLCASASRAQWARNELHARDDRVSETRDHVTANHKTPARVVHLVIEEGRAVSDDRRTRMIDATKQRPRADAPNRAQAVVIAVLSPAKRDLGKRGVPRGPQPAAHDDLLLTATSRKTMTCVPILHRRRA